MSSDPVFQPKPQTKRSSPPSNPIIGKTRADEWDRLLNEMSQETADMKSDLKQLIVKTNRMKSTLVAINVFALIVEIIVLSIIIVSIFS